MSYAVVYMPLKTNDGQIFMTADVPIAELTQTASDVAAQKIVATWPTLVAQAVQQLDAYADQKLWPNVRTEVNHAMSSATWRAAVGGAAAAAVFGTLLYYLKRSR